MKFRPDKKIIHRGIIALAVILLSICFFYLLFYGTRFGSTIKTVSVIFMPIIYGVVFAYLLTPVVNGIERYILEPILLKCKVKVERKWKKAERATSLILSLLITFLAIFGFFSLIIPQMISSIQSISTQIPAFVRSATTQVNKFSADYPDIMNFVQDNMGKYSVEIQQFLNTNIIPQLENVGRAFSLILQNLLGLVKVLWNFLVGIIISCYVLYNKELFAGQGKKAIYALFKTETANKIISNCRFTSKTFSGFISGKIIDSIIIGFLCFVGITLLQMPYPVLISVVVGVTNVIPFFGPYLGAIPCAFLILMVSPLQCLYFLIFILVLQQFDGNVLGPKILGESTGLSGFWVIFSITIFGGMFGILGMIIGVPIFAVLYAGVKSYLNKKLTGRGLPVQTENYLEVGSIENHVFIKHQLEKKKTYSLFAGKNKTATVVDDSTTANTEPAMRSENKNQDTKQDKNQDKSHSETAKDAAQDR